MKRDDGVNRSKPIATFAFSHANRDRLHVAKGVVSWCVYKGQELVGETLTFAAAIHAAQEEARR